MYEEAVKAFPVILGKLGNGDPTNQFVAIQLINALLKRCQGKPRSDIIKFRLTPNSEEALKRFNNGIQLVEHDSELRQEMIEHHQELTRTIAEGLGVHLSRGQFHHQLKTKVTGGRPLDFLGVLEELDTILEQELV